MRLVQIAQYEPVHPHAYVVRMGWANVTPLIAVLTIPILAAAYVLVRDGVTRGSLSLLVVAGIMSGLGIPLLVRKVIRRAVPFAIDAPGVYLGDDSGDTTWLVPWGAVREVVLLRRRVETGDDAHWQRCVGVRADLTRIGYSIDDVVNANTGRVLSPDEQQALRKVLPELRLPAANDVLPLREIRGWTLDRGELDAALQRFAPNVPVVEGPDLTADPAAMPSLLELWRRTRGTSPPPTADS